MTCGCQFCGGAVAHPTAYDPGATLRRPEVSAVTAARLFELNDGRHPCGHEQTGPTWLECSTCEAAEAEAEAADEAAAAAEREAGR